MIINAKYGNFELNIYVIMTNLGIKYFNSKIISKGSFGIIYKIKYEHKFYIVKCL
jgi:hypothetical protein